jgi:branched-chain amino acid transport system ATP-binding protein
LPGKARETAMSEDNEKSGLEENPSVLSPASPLLSIRNLETGYADSQELWDISLDVLPGELVALVGANGAGKTTLLTAISRLLPIWRGSIIFAGQELSRTSAERVVSLGLAHVPQGRRLFAALTVEENLRLGAYTRRAGSAHAIADDLERVFTFLPKLRERRKQPAGSLSGGEQQMCAIGRGLMARPELLLIDELSLGLAPNIVDNILATLDNIHRQEKLSILLVEQDVQIALERADRGYVIEQGRMVLSSSATALLQSPLVRAAYLGEIGEQASDEPAAQLPLGK